MKKKVFSFLDVLIISIIISVVMTLFGGIVIYKNMGGTNFSLLSSDKSIRKFLIAYMDLKTNYYDNLDTDKIIEGAISGMYDATGDPYTTYLDDNNSLILDETLRGKYKGIGIEVKKDDNGAKIVNIINNTPADKVGLKKDDIITQIDLEDIKDKTIYEISKMITDKSDTVNLTISRNNQLLSYDIPIEDMYEQVVKSQLLNYKNKRIGYISLETFSENSYNQFKENLMAIEKNKLDGLIIDLRDNSGGYLSSARDISELFLEKGKIIYYLQNKNRIKKYKDTTGDHRNYNIAIITNGGTASAAEILAGALKYSYGATLIGEKSYGKGKVQEKSALSSGTIKYTSALWLLPNKESIDGKGLLPNIIIEIDQSTYDYKNIMTDTQVLTALEELC